jgi:hypothetical protein
MGGCQHAFPGKTIDLVILDIKGISDCRKRINHPKPCVFIDKISLGFFSDSLSQRPQKVDLRKFAQIGVRDID